MNKKIYFHKNLSELILKEEKTCTWRIWDESRTKKERIAIGDTVTFIITDTKVEFATARITDIKDTKFKYLSDQDLKGKFSSKKEMYDTFSKYYNILVTKETDLKIISFKLLK